MTNSYTADPSRPWLYLPARAVKHAEEHYESLGHDVLLKMQQEHFWYRGRHRFLNKAVQKWAKPLFPGDQSPEMIDLGGGCGGWVNDLYNQSHWNNPDISLGDSSVYALEMARETLPDHVNCYQTDLMDLQWNDRWDIAFLLDVLEHLPEPAAVMSQIAKALRPGGLLFVTVPALQFFWSFVDEFGHHQKRYHRNDFQPLALESGFEIMDCRYFMFLLSPLVYLSRNGRSAQSMTRDEIKATTLKLHQVPPGWLNGPLGAIFNLETPLGHKISFPWGTSLLCVVRKRK